MNVTVAVLILAAAATASIRSRKLKIIMAIVGFSAILAFSSFFEPQEPIVLRAVEQTNPAALSNEIRLMKIYADGEGVSFPQVFSGNKWKPTHDSFAWRGFDKNNEPVLTGYLPRSGTYVLMFEKNPWRGMVEVIVGDQHQVVDCYSPEYGEIEMVVAYGTPVTYMALLQHKVIMFVIILMMMLLLCLVLPCRTRKTRDWDREDALKPFSGTDWGNLIGVISVILMMIYTMSIDKYQGLYTGGYNFPDGLNFLITASLSAAVFPLLVMMTGARLLLRRETMRQTMKRALPLVIIYITWNLVYGARALYYGSLSMAEALRLLVVPGDYDGIRLLLVVIGLHVVLPVIRPFYVWLETTMRIGKVVLWFGLLSAAYTMMNLGQVVSSAVLSAGMLALIYIGFAVLGAICVKKRKQLTARKWIAVAGIIVGWSVTAGTVMLLCSRHYIAELSEFYAGAGLFVSSLSMFMLILQLTEKQAVLRQLRPFIAKASSYSPGFFLVHVLLMDHLNFKVGQIYISGNMHSLPLMLVAVFIYYILSFLMIYVISRIPVLRKVIGQ